jgi:hypothetical protein
MTKLPGSAFDGGLARAFAHALMIADAQGDAWIVSCAPRRCGF